MKRKLIRGGLVLALALIGAGFLASATAQSIVPAQLQNTFTVVTNATTTGQLGQYIVLNGLTAPRPGTYTVDWTVSGTALTTCTFNAQGSSDGVNWYYVDNSSPVSCVSTGNEFVTGKPVLYLRINIAAISGGDATSKIVFHYVGGRS
jgi:hypothetical protein